MNNFIRIKNIRAATFLCFLFVIALFSPSCKEKEEPIGQLAVSSLDVEAEPEGDSTEVTITCDNVWTASVNNSVPWITIDRTGGEAGSTALKLKFTDNRTGASRYGIVTVKSPNGQARRIKISQPNPIFPTYNTSPKAPDATGMGSTAMQLAQRMTMGWNFFNTMDAPGWETAWGWPKITQQQVNLVKSTGMNAIRLPVTWSAHIVDQKTYKIDPLWLARVKEVVQYCMNADMYVILNTHHDGYLDCKARGIKQDSVNAKHKATWEQIATTMRDFDERLIFASANEPDAKTQEETETLMRYHQTFVKVVRSTGGRNAYRSIVIQAPSTSLELMVEQTTPWPTDPVPQKMMFEFHFYAPPNFCILGDGGNPLPADASWGKEWYFWGKDFHTTNPLFLDRNSDLNWGDERYVISAMRSVKEKFTSKGLPVIMGEYDIQWHADNLKGYTADSLLCVRSGWHYYSVVTKQAKINGIVPFLWAGVFSRGKPRSDGWPERDAIIGSPQALDSLKIAGGF